MGVSWAPMSSFSTKFWGAETAGSKKNDDPPTVKANTKEGEKKGMMWEEEVQTS